MTGELAAGQLTKLSSGLHPVTGDRLRETAGVKAEKAIGAFDFTFSCAKSVSLLSSSGDRELSSRILDAQPRAVESSLRVLESEAAFVRRRKGGHVREHAKIIVSRFDHRTSRLCDPQLHEHDIVVNTALGPDGRWTALDWVRVRDFKLALGAIHEAEIRANLSEGPPLEALDSKGLSELDCVDKGTLRDFSKRRQQLERDVRGSVENPAAMAGAAVRTRQAKREVGRSSRRSPGRSA